MGDTLESLCTGLVIIIMTPVLVPLVVSAFVATNPFFLAGLLYGKRPQPPSGEVENVPGLYGPGAYWAWVLCTISAISSSAAEGHSSSIVTPDQIISFIYSTSSMYWYYIRAAWYGIEGPALLQDHSVQAASFILHISSLFHALGAISSTEDKRIPWLFFAIWDCWLLWISPMMTVDLRSMLVTTTILPILFSGCLTLTIQYQSSHRGTALSLLLPFIVLEAVRTRFFADYSFLMSPRTTYNITDLDQIVSLISAITVIVYQWELWKPSSVLQRSRAYFRLTPVRSNSIRLESREDEVG
ncbi:hypothetical protein CPB86DRAFT_158062 [Serendipita vermifera]|nr:hypothetical protein CPB86DRAFT_158062 [Serendipita vermifera]